MGGLLPGLARAGAAQALPSPAYEIQVPRLEAVTSPEALLDVANPEAIDPRLTRIEHFVQRTPDDGALASLPTSVHVGYDETYLYLLFDARDDAPEQVRATLSSRENFGGDDSVLVFLDTFRDRQRAYVFRVNPLGVQWDAIFSESGGLDATFDTVWRSGGRLTPTGYLAWMAIPWKSLRFPGQPPEGEQRWGLILNREVRRGQGEDVYWPPVTSRVDGFLNQAGTLSGMKEIAPGSNRQLIPYSTFRSFELLDPDRPGPELRREADRGQLGLDTKLVLRERFVLDATVNPDFSQVESDTPQITVNQRFEVFFPERRPFFLENSDVFQTPFNLLFTRRIADPQLGVRFTGKAGRFNLGALVIDDEAPGKRVEPGDPLHGEAARFGVLRVSRDLGDQSRLGGLYVARELEGSYNRVAAVDGRWKLGEHWVASAQAATSDTRLLDGLRLQGSAYELDVNRRGRRLGYQGRYLDIADGFRAEAGFVSRTGLRQSTQFLSFWTWPEDSPVIFWGPEAFVQQSWDRDGTLIDELYEGSLEWHFPGQTFVELNVSSGSITLRPDEFPALTADRTFSQVASVLELGTSFDRRFQLSSNLQWARDVNFAPPPGQPPAPAEVVGGNLNVLIRALRRLRVDLTWLSTRVEDRATEDRAFVNQIARIRGNLQLSRELSLRLILEYDQLSVDPAQTSLESHRNLNTDLLVTYRLNPWTAVFLGYNSNLRNVEVVQEGGVSTIVPTESDLTRDGRQIFLKVSYLLRF